jgi:hypothetical protein
MIGIFRTVLAIELEVSQTPLCLILNGKRESSKVMRKKLSPCRIPLFEFGRLG